MISSFPIPLNFSDYRYNHLDCLHAGLQTSFLPLTQCFFKVEWLTTANMKRPWCRRADGGVGISTAFTLTGGGVHG